MDVEMAQLKAIRFVKAAPGQAAPAAPGPAGEPEQVAVGRKIRVLFKDGELLLGTCPSRKPIARRPSCRPPFIVVM